MIFYFAGLHPVIIYFVLFSILIIIAMISLFGVHRLFKKDLQLETGGRFIVPFFTINGAILGFILAMILVETWKNYQGEKENITNEMSNFVAVYRLASGLHPKDSAAIKNQIKRIVKDIVEVSWYEMERGQDGWHVSKLMNELYRLTLSAKANDDLQRDIRKELLNKISKASELRRHRFLKVTQSVVPDSMWPVIFLCITISFVCGSFF